MRPCGGFGVNGVLSYRMVAEQVWGGTGPAPTAGSIRFWIRDAGEIGTRDRSGCGGSSRTKGQCDAHQSMVSHRSRRLANFNFFDGFTPSSRQPHSLLTSLLRHRTIRSNTGHINLQGDMS